MDGSGVVNDPGTGRTCHEAEATVGFVRTAVSGTSQSTTGPDGRHRNHRDAIALYRRPEDLVLPEVGGELQENIAGGGCRLSHAHAFPVRPMAEQGRPWRIAMVGDGGTGRVR